MASKIDRLVVDANILFSILISPNGVVADVFERSVVSLEFYAPNYIIEELDRHWGKLQKLSRIQSEKNLIKVRRLLFRNMVVVGKGFIPRDTLVKAYDLCRQVDPNDTDFVALSLHLNAPLWTGDKRILKLAQDSGQFQALDTQTLLASLAL